jgi:alpha-D-ribose 1-methylphosphonate 5-triphosphate synthase subunit PhnH
MQDIDSSPVTGFADPVGGSQSVFRSALMALSRPGRPVVLHDLPEAPDGLPPALAALALTLVDYETPLWLDEPLRASQEIRGFIAFHTGAPIVDAPSRARMALSTAAAALPAFDEFCQGTAEYPDQSTTIIAIVEAFEGGTPLSLTGPGIPGQVTISPAGAPADLAARLKRNRTHFPCGIDLVLAAGSRMIGLPRSIRVVG